MSRAPYKIATAISLTYALVGGLWLALSAVYVAPSNSSVADRLNLTLCLDLAFVGITSVLLYAGLRLIIRRTRQESEHGQEHKAYLALATEGAGIGIWSWDLVQHTGMVDRRFAAMLGYSGDELQTLTPQSWAAHVHNQDFKLAQALSREHQNGETPYFEAEMRVRHKAGHWLWILTRGRVMARSASGRALSMAGTHIDITERKHTAQLLERKQAMHSALSQTNKAIVQIKDRQKLFETVCDICLQLGSFSLVWVGQKNLRPDSFVTPIAIAGDGKDFIALHTPPLQANGRGPTSEAAREGHTVLNNDFSRSPRVEARDALRERYQIRSGIALPIRSPDFDGTLTLYAKEVGFFDEEVTALIQEIADDLSFALISLHTSEARARDEVRLRLHAQLFEESRDGMIITDARNRIVVVNRAFSEFTGYSPDELEGETPSKMRSGRHERDFYHTMWTTLNKTGCWQGEVWNRCKDGEVRATWLTINLVLDSQGLPAHYFGVYTDLSERRAQDELAWLQHFDPLTRLPNRLLLEDRTREAILHAQQSKHQLALLSLNLDHFHDVNESFGHLIGDEVLREVGSRLREVLEETATVCRLSGDHFMVLIPELLQASAVMPHVERLLASVKPTVRFAECAINLSARAGIALFPEDGEDFASLFKNADAARVSARQEVINTYRFYADGQNARARDRLHIVNILRQALDNNWLCLHYQPQVTSDTRRITGVEALLRIQHPEQGLLMPAAFIPAAEETGLIVPIGAWVIQEACQQLRRWHDAGFESLRMAVNLSPKQLADPGLIACLESALAQACINADTLELEFTESVAMHDTAATMALLKEFKRLGLHLAMDDFGTGYSNLNYLKRFPLDRLKIDQSFVRNLGTDASDTAIVEAIIALARALGLQTLAEGVETEQQAQQLMYLGCDELQGYYFSRPATIHQVAQFLGQALPQRTNLS